MRTDPRRLRFLVQVPLSATWLLAGATSHASAQVTARNFQELGLKVKAGDTVYITDDSGKQEREAQILELTPSLLAVSVGGVRRDLSASNVSRIRQRLPDSRKNGALIGFLVGASGATAGAVAMASPSGSCQGLHCCERRLRRRHWRAHRAGHRLAGPGPEGHLHQGR
jgi:hypothetical protein